MRMQSLIPSIFNRMLVENAQYFIFRRDQGFNSKPDREILCNCKTTSFIIYLSEENLLSFLSKFQARIKSTSQILEFDSS